MNIKFMLVTAGMCLAISPAGFCQNAPSPVPDIKIIADLQTPDDQNRKATITQSPEIERLIFFHSENQQKKQVAGFRILIYTETGSSARQKGQDVRSRFFREYPGIEPYLSWDPPNFKVYVGDFRTRTDALRNLRNIVRSYPNAIIVENLNINPQQ